MEIPEASANQKGLRLAELLASLSLAIDLATGQPMEWVLGTCLLAVRLGEGLGLCEDDLHEVYYLSLLRHVGCTATAHSDAQLFGDELAMADGMALDPDDAGQAIRFLFRHVGSGLPASTRARMIARLIAAGPSGAAANHVAQCEVAVQLCAALPVGPRLQRAIAQVFERWDGKGVPGNLRGDEIVLPVRIAQLAQDAATFYRLGGVESAKHLVRKRSGRLLDPGLADSFCTRATGLLSELDSSAMWLAVLGAEPGTPIRLSEDAFDAAASVVADFGDLKSPYTLGHSRGVAQLAARAAQTCSLPASDVTAIRRAGMLHDLGRVGVSASIWGKPGVLTEGEWESVRLHPYYTERVFARSEALAPLGSLGATDHERLDGSGYHRRLPSSMLSLSARLLAAADTYQALTEPRPHRAARSPDEAMGELRREVKAGRIDSRAADAVEQAAGLAKRASRSARTSDLSEREIEVLRLIARGFQNREVAARLSLSVKTVEHHIQHIYDKIGVSTRAAATLYTLQHNLLD